MAAKKFKLGDDERLEFGVDWSAYLTAESAEIASSEWVVPDELTASDEGASATATTVVLTNATGVVGDVFRVTNIVTLNDAQAQVAERSFDVQLVEAKFK